MPTGPPRGEAACIHDVQCQLRCPGPFLPAEASRRRWATEHQRAGRQQGSGRAFPRRQALLGGLEIGDIRQPDGATVRRVGLELGVSQQPGESRRTTVLGAPLSSAAVLTQLLEQVWPRETQ